MKLHHYTYVNEDALAIFIDKNIDQQNNILIQVYSGVLDTKKVQNVLNLLSKKLPFAVIIGASTTGEIAEGKLQENTIQINFSLFETSTVRANYYETSGFETGVAVAKDFLHEDTKAIIAFSEALHSDSELFLEGYSSIEQEVPVAGGNAGDNYHFEKTFVIYNDNIYFDGIVVCAIDSQELHVSTNYSMEWTPVGKEMRITKADGNTVYEIDGENVQEVYKHYLGEEILQNFPASVIEFPLVKCAEEVSIARSIVAKTDDGGFVYAGHFQEGDIVRFAIGNIDEILNRAKILNENILRRPVEATYIFSCSVRKMFLKEELEYEFGLIDQIAPSVGFFTYGEFYHAQKNNQLLNITTTTLSLSENNVLKKRTHFEERQSKSSMLKSLTNLVNVSEKTLSLNIAKLDQYKQILDKSAIVSKTDKEGVITYVNDEFCRVSGYTREELIGQNHRIVRHPDMQQNVFTKMWEDITNKRVWHGTIKNLAKKRRSVLCQIGHYADSGR